MRVSWTTRHGCMIQARVLHKGHKGHAAEEADTKWHLRAASAAGEALRSGEGDGVGVARQMQLAFSSLSLMRFCRRLHKSQWY